MNTSFWSITVKELQFGLYIKNDDEAKEVMLQQINQFILDNNNDSCVIGRYLLMFGSYQKINNIYDEEIENDDFDSYFDDLLSDENVDDIIGFVFIYKNTFDDIECCLS